jgi:aminoglycoside 2'-N-acetyltransferase I
MTAVQLRHTADLAPGTLAGVHALLIEAFEPGEGPNSGSGFSGDDWEHTLGGMHALLWEGEELIGHGAVVQRRLVHGGRALRAGYVEGVAVRADRRRRGRARALMTPLERVIRAAYDLGALAASAQAGGFYSSRGWINWRGPTSVLTPSGMQPTPDEDEIYVLPGEVDLDVAAELTCDWRGGDVW